MKKIATFILFFLTTAFGNEFILDNQTSYPAKNQKIAIQFADSAGQVDQENKALMYDGTLDKNTLYSFTKKGKIQILTPKKATYFRIVAWSKEGTLPDFSTNWIEIVPKTTYTLKLDHLVPVVLMSGMGC